jgi:hypothetical protein
MKRLTKAQAVALAKWEDGNGHNWKASRVLEDVFFRLLDAKYLGRCGYLMTAITDKGREALAEYRKRNQ